MKKVVWDRDVQVVEVEVMKVVVLREVEFQIEVEKMNVLIWIEKFKVEFFSKVSVEYEIKVCIYIFLFFIFLVNCLYI